jgi:hypothetical protein
MKRVAVIVAASMALLVAPSSQASHSWNGYHWARTSNPLKLKMVKSLTGQWPSLLPLVSADWSASTVLDTSIQAGQNGLLGRLSCGAIAGKIHVCNANYGPNLWFGQATVWISSDHISQAVTQLNDFYFTGSYNNNTARRHVMCQEIGHDFGLDHQHGVPTCMEDNNGTLNTASYVTPNAHDYNELATIYSHLDSFNSAKSASAALGSSGPARIVRAGNQTILTFIFWVR